MYKAFNEYQNTGPQNYSRKFSFRNLHSCGIDFVSAIKIYFVLPDLADGEIAQLLYN